MNKTLAIILIVLILWLSGYFGWKWYQANKAKTTDKKDSGGATGNGSTTTTTAKIPVTALQNGLNQYLTTKLVEDGIYGDFTAAAWHLFVTKVLGSTQLVPAANSKIDPTSKLYLDTMAVIKRDASTIGAINKVD